MVSAAPPSYSHATEPRAVENRSKFRAPEEQPANIMFDRRVVRGSTYSQPIDTPGQMQELERTKRMTRGGQQMAQSGGRASTPDAVEGRKRTSGGLQVLLPAAPLSLRLG